MASLHGQWLPVARALPLLLKPKPVHKCSDAPSQEVRWFGLRNGFARGHWAPSSAVSEDRDAVRALSQS
jgi:hypothetical protein